MNVQLTANRLMPTVRAIIEIPSLSYFLIGLTKSSCQAKRQQYRGEGIQHFVMLADRLVQADALDLESALQLACFDCPATEPRYHPDKDRSHRNSVGGVQEADGSYSVYLAWHSADAAD